jgi:hypothetical protein
VAIGKVFLPVLLFSPVYITPPTIRTHFYLHVAIDMMAKWVEKYFHSLVQWIKLRGAARGGGGGRKRELYEDGISKVPLRSVRNDMKVERKILILKQILF